MTTETRQPSDCQWKFEDVEAGMELMCGKPPLLGSDLCLFHKPQKTPEEVQKFQEAVRAQVEADNFNFVGYRFPPDWDSFSHRTLKGADFHAAEFAGDVSFVGTTFEPVKEAQRAAGFFRACFGGKANFKDVCFGGLADFRSARFGREAHFVVARFGGLANFWNARFGGETVFWKAYFSGGAGFQDARFGGVANFLRAHFNGEADFQDAHFRGVADFEKAVFSDISFWIGTVFHQNADFTRVAQVDRSRFQISLRSSGDSKPERETRFAQPAAGQHLCRLAKESARRAGDDHVAGEHYYYERKYVDLARFPWPFFAWRWLMHKLGHLKLPEIPQGHDDKPLMTQEELETVWLRPKRDPELSWTDKLRGAAGLLFGWVLFGYGERPWRVFGWSLFLICFWALLYWGLRLVEAHAPAGTLIGLGKALYFSALVFTTMAFGDFQPVPSTPGMFLVASEAFLGMFMMALFVVAVAKRFTRG